MGVSECGYFDFIGQFKHHFLCIFSHETTLFHLQDEWIVSV